MGEAAAEVVDLAEEDTEEADMEEVIVEAVGLVVEEDTEEAVAEALDMVEEVTAEVVEDFVFSGPSLMESSTARKKTIFVES